MTPTQLHDLLARIPEQPGVYLMKGKRGEILYIGKAVHLRNRVRSYFQKASSDGRAFIAFLDDELGDLETFVTRSEKEALLLENELIKKHKPRYNVKLRDDKNFLCLRLDTSHPFPRLETVRRVAADGATYFGPYASAASLRETLRVVNRWFRLRTCTDHVLTHRKRPCLQYQLGRCPAPCVQRISASEYRPQVEAVALFLAGRSEELQASLQQRMRGAVEALRFEEAARMRDQLTALQRSLERQSVAAPSLIDQDVIGWHRQDGLLTVFVLFVRRGRVGDGRAFHFNRQQFPDAELLASFVGSYYLDGALIPDEVLLPFEVDVVQGLRDALAERRGRAVSVEVPQRGPLAGLVRLACENALKSQRERTARGDQAELALQRLEQHLRLPRTPRRIECFDISHFQGAHGVASSVVAIDGTLAKSEYRRYRLRTVAGNDDFASMREVVSRRFGRNAADRAVPDLLVIDGGKGQVAAAVAALADLGREGIPVVGLAKSRAGEVGSDDRVQHSSERLFLSGRSNPVVLSPSAPELVLLTLLRDEAHRFAIGYQRRSARRSLTRSALDDVEGIGPVRRRQLLRHFGSVGALSRASAESIAAAGSISLKLASAILEAVRG